MTGERRKGQAQREQKPAEQLNERVRESDGRLMPVTARGEATRRRILDAAEAVFGEKGYHEASVTEITHRAQVAQGTFYLYFHSKREIFLKLVEDLGNRMRQAMRSGAAGAEGRLEMERGGFAGFFAFARAHRQLFRIVQEADRVDQATYREYYERIARSYARGLRAAMEAGEIRPMDAETLAFALIGIGHFLAERWLIWPETHAQAPDSSSENAADSAPYLPEFVFATLMDFLEYGLKPRPPE
jgi:AcrR family transcriptional regulator